MGTPTPRAERAKILFLFFFFAGIAFAQTWVEMQILTASNKESYDYFGYSVSLTDYYALVGAFLANHGSIYDAGAAYVFVRSGTTWSEQAILTASNKAILDQFGSSVSLSNSYALVGAISANPGGVEFAGAAYVFVRSGTTWSEQAILTASNKATHDQFGSSVLLTSDDDAFLGTFNNPRTYSFTRDSSIWTESTILNTCCPRSVTHTNSYMIESQPTENVGGLTYAGQVRVFYNSDLLNQFFALMSGQNWRSNNNWNSKLPYCSWFGIICDSNCDSLTIQQNKCPIVSMNLEANNLEGTLLSIISPDMHTLNLANNKITGTIPDLSLPKLKNLYLNNNQLTGNSALYFLLIFSSQTWRTLFNANLDATLNRHDSQLQHAKPAKLVHQ